MARAFKNAAYAAANKINSLDDVKFVPRLIAWGLFLFVGIPVLAALFIAIVMATAPEAKASSAATSRVIGTPASIIADCEIHRAFARTIIDLRDEGRTRAEVNGIVAGIAKANGHSYESTIATMGIVDRIWPIAGNAAGISNAVFEACMKGRK